MTECFFCGGEGAEFDAVTNEGIMKVCRKCSFEEEVPLIKKPTTYQLREAERKKPSFQEKANEERKEIEKEKVGRINVEKQNVTLKDIVDAKYESKVVVEEKPKLNLIDNFHWIVLRTRRKKHLTQGQLASEIHESEAAIKMIETGQLPEDDYRLVNKLENFLGIKIREDENYEPIMDQEPVRVLDFDRKAMDNLTISDLQEMKKTREEIEKEELMEDIKVKLLEEGEIDID